MQLACSTHMKFLRYIHVDGRKPSGGDPELLLTVVGRSMVGIRLDRLVPPH